MKRPTELPAEEVRGAGPSAPAVPAGPAMILAAVTADGAFEDDNRADGEGPDVEAGGGRLQPSTDCSTQVEDVASEEMLDGVVMS